MTRGTRATVFALTAIALVVAVGGAAFGFTDDSSAGGTTFVTAANALKAAGCASGFGDGSFGYGTNVTRGQDAIFQMACAPGAAYKNAGSTPIAVGTAGSTPGVVTLATETITAGINPGGLQVLLVHGHATLGVGATAGAVTANPTLSITPPAGGTAPSPSSISCNPASLATTAAANMFGPNTTAVDCDGGFVVPTGQALTVTFSAFVNPTIGPDSITPGTLTAWTTPRGNTVSSPTSLS